MACDFLEGHRLWVLGMCERLDSAMLAFMRNFSLLIRFSGRTSGAMGIPDHGLTDSTGHTGNVLRHPKQRRHLQGPGPAPPVLHLHNGPLPPHGRIYVPRFNRHDARRAPERRRFPLEMHATNHPWKHRRRRCLRGRV